jgi:enoyl-[acyl-carrier protein] reductase III
MCMTGQTVLITGGTRGIGRAIAMRLAREKPSLIAVSYCQNHPAARETVAELRSLGVDADAFSTDVSDVKLLQGLFDKVRERSGGRLDVFVSNAARTSFRPVLELDRRSWQKIIDLNAGAFLAGSQMAATMMRENGGGRIVALSSLGSRYATRNYAGLGAAKATIEALTRYLAVELAPLGINVNAVCGGFVDTHSMRLAPDYDDLEKYVADHTPVHRIATPEDLAGVVAFLCSSDSDWIRGQTLVADGGFSLTL